MEFNFRTSYSLGGARHSTGCPCKKAQIHIPFSPNWHAKNPSSWEALGEPQHNPGHLDIIVISCHHHHHALSGLHYNTPSPPIFYLTKAAAVVCTLSAVIRKDILKIRDLIYVRQAWLLFWSGVVWCKRTEWTHTFHFILVCFNGSLILIMICKKRMRRLLCVHSIDSILNPHLQPDIFPPHL